MGDTMAFTKSETKPVTLSSGATNRLSRRKVLEKFLPFFALIGMVIIFGVGDASFLTASNLFNILRQSAVLLVAALGTTFIILMGCIDLSIGSVITLAGCIAAIVMSSIGSIFLAVLGAVAIGSVAGLLNGIIFTKGKIPSFLVTLGMMGILDGMALILLGGRPIQISSAGYKWLSSGMLVGHLPNVALWSLIIFVISIFIAFKTRFGRYMFAIGGGERVSKLSGVPVDRFKIYSFVVTGVFSGLAAVLLTARVGAGTPRMAEAMLLDSIAAVVMGGTSLTGGTGGPHRTILGVLIISVLSNGLNIMSVSPYHQTVIKGAVVILAVLMTIDRSKVLVNK